MTWFDTRAAQAFIAADDGATLLTDLLEDGDFSDADVSAAATCFRLAKAHLDIARHRHEVPS